MHYNLFFVFIYNIFYHFPFPLLESLPSITLRPSIQITNFTLTPSIAHPLHYHVILFIYYIFYHFSYPLSESIPSNALHSSIRITNFTLTPSVSHPLNYHLILFIYYLFYHFFPRLGLPMHILHQFGSLTSPFTILSLSLSLILSVLSPHSLHPLLILPLSSSSLPSHALLPSIRTTNFTLYHSLTPSVCHPLHYHLHSRTLQALSPGTNFSLSPSSRPAQPRRTKPPVRARP